MIFIKTHKDFDYNIPIYKENYNNFSIICREKLNNNYPINVIWDNDNFLNQWSHLYGELTYHYYIYKHLNQYDDIIGLLQFKRYFNEYVLNNYKEILKEYDIILPNQLGLNLIKQFNECHVSGLLESLIRLIYEYMPLYRNIDFYNIDFIIPHNIFIMKKCDYINYCKFMFNCYKILNKQYNIHKKIDKPSYFRILAFLGERISTIFYIQNFIEKRKIFYCEQPFNFDW